MKNQREVRSLPKQIRENDVYRISAVSPSFNVNFAKTSRFLSRNALHSTSFLIKSLFCKAHYNTFDHIRKLFRFCSATYLFVTLFLNCWKLTTNGTEKQCEKSFAALREIKGEWEISRYLKSIIPDRHSMAWRQNLHDAFPRPPCKPRCIWLRPRSRLNVHALQLFRKKFSFPAGTFPVMCEKQKSRVSVYSQKRRCAVTYRRIKPQPLGFFAISVSRGC